MERYDYCFMNIYRVSTYLVKKSIEWIVFFFPTYSFKSRLQLRLGIVQSNDI